MVSGFGAGAGVGFGAGFGLVKELLLYVNDYLSSPPLFPDPDEFVIITPGDLPPLARRTSQ